MLFLYLRIKKNMNIYVTNVRFNNNPIYIHYKCEWFFHQFKSVITHIQWFFFFIVFGWRKPEYPEKTTDLSQVTDKTLSHNVVSREWDSNILYDVNCDMTFQFTFSGIYIDLRWIFFSRYSWFHVLRKRALLV
jgi:hypothetical protein